MATTWNPADKAANITLSNGNLTAAGITTGAARANVRSTTSHSSGTYGMYLSCDYWAGL